MKLGCQKLVPLLTPHIKKQFVYTRMSLIFESCWVEMDVDILLREEQR